MKKKKKPESKTKWHELLGTLLKDLLSPVNIHVSTEIEVMAESPRIDILLLRREEPEWTDEQLELLPDGIRDTKASDILLELKYTESLNDDVLQQVLGYDFFYRKHQTMNREQVQSFLLSAKKPQTSTLKKLGYQITEHPGVYRSKFRLVRQVILLSLNELSNEPHNAFVKCFASHRQEKQEAFQVLENQVYNSLNMNLKYFLDGLKGIWFTLKKGDDMNLELTPELITAWGEKWGKSYLAHLKPEERLVGLKPREILAGLKPDAKQEILYQFKPEERLVGLKPEEILAGLNPEQLKVLEAYFKQHESEK